MKHTATLTLTVGWGDCAPSGAVYYPNYFRWFDEAMWNFFDAAGWPLRQLEEAHGIVGLPLIETGAKFKGPCRLHDILEIETRITGFKRKTLEMTHTVTNTGTNGAAVAVEATDVRFWGVRHPDGSGRLKAAEIPTDVIAFFGGP